MVMNIGDALSAYQKNGTSGSNASSSSDLGAGGSFSDALKSYAGDAIKTLEGGEQAAAAGAMGKTDITSVVTAINDATLMLQTVVTIRDKVISAYQAITQGSI